MKKEEIETIAPILDSARQSIQYYDPVKRSDITIQTYTGDWELVNKDLNYAEEVETIAPDIPVLLFDTSGHQAICNVTALKKAGLYEMYRLWEEGYEVVEGIKEDRGEESGVHRFAANAFYSIISKATKMDMSSSSDFKLLDRKVVDTLNSMPERNVFFRALSFWVGFKKTSVSYCVQERTAGESKWSTKSLIKYAITNISSFSSVPLHIITLLGFVMLIISVIFTIIALVQKITGQALGGFTTVIILLLFASSIIMVSLGIIAYYIGKMYDELKGRPRYIISEECGARK